MKLGLKALVIALVMALAAVPAAFAKNAGHEGHGKPSWAGQGKPSWAGSGHAASKAHHEKKEKKAKKPKHHGADAAAEDDSADDVDLDGLNPAWYCKTLRDEMTTLERDFATMFGTNPNHANAFGKCVSRRAHGEDLSDAAGGDDEQGTCDTAEPPDRRHRHRRRRQRDRHDRFGRRGGGDESSDDEATDPEECESNDSGSDEPADDEQVKAMTSRVRTTRVKTRTAPPASSTRAISRRLSASSGSSAKHERSSPREAPRRLSRLFGAGAL